MQTSISDDLLLLPANVASDQAIKTKCYHHLIVAHKMLSHKYLNRPITRVIYRT